MPGPHIVAPLSGRECVWYSYRVEHRESRFARSRRSNWTTVEAGTSEELFLLVDDTDVCVIDPEGAEVTPSSRDIWYANSPRPSSGPSSSWLSLAVAVYRYSEQRLDVGQHSYAIGDFKTMGTDYHGDLKQDVIAKLRAWKQDAHKIRVFDTNHDDEVDVEEWEHARRVAEREAMLVRTQHSIMDDDTSTRRHA